MDYSQLEDMAGDVMIEVSKQENATPELISAALRLIAYVRAQNRNKVPDLPKPPLSISHDYEALFTEDNTL